MKCSNNYAIPLQNLYWRGVGGRRPTLVRHPHKRGKFEKARKLVPRLHTRNLGKHNMRHYWAGEVGGDGVHMQ